MKRILAMILVFAFVLPMLAPWFPAHAVEAIHAQQERHHEIASHHTPHHDMDSDEGHKAHFDILAYFDHLHINLKVPSVQKLTPPMADVHGFDVAVLSHFTPAIVPSMTKQSQGPPVFIAQISSAPVRIYLATQRLRI